VEVEIRPLGPDELDRVGEIDRSERIDALYVQDGVRLEVREGDRSAPGWDPEEQGEHSVAAQRRFLRGLVGRGGVALGAFEDERLVGIGVVLPRLRPGTAQLAYLYVTDGRRARGIGGRLSDELERVAHEAGATSVAVSATPSVNTVDFYRRRGYEPLAEPLPELFELEPDDVHMLKRL
jgi:GNAT superfamily N-acetyltransferase